MGLVPFRVVPLCDLPAKPKFTAVLEHALLRRGIRDGSRSYHATQKGHWDAWLGPYNGPGYYGRKAWNRSAEFVYNHINCPPMVLWLGEAAGVPKRQGGPR